MPFYRRPTPISGGVWWKKMYYIPGHVNKNEGIVAIIATTIIITIPYLYSFYQCCMLVKLLKMKGLWL